MTQLPAPEEPVLVKLTDAEVAEMIEEYIDFVDSDGRSVHLPTQFVRHYTRRHDNALPTVCGIATLPFVLPNGELQSGQGLNRDLGLIFRAPPELDAILPRPEDCTPTAVAYAMRFLVDEWLCDVATDYAGKCVLIAFGCTIIERLVLDQRPAFFVSAGQRGSGKTTACNMITAGVLGRMASACAWSKSEEERRKSLFSFLAAGVALIFWDNIERGAALSCPSIEKSLTAYTYTDRVLGVSEVRTVPATTIQAFTGNNVGPRGDLASRSLHARLGTDRPDPENREFKHADPLAWTNANRAEILQALYVVLRGNPRLCAKDPAQAQTRFKSWWHLVGSAVENAARQHANHVASTAMELNPACPPQPLSFKSMLAEAETEEEQTSSLATVLDALLSRWPGSFQASDVTAFLSEGTEDAVNFKAALEMASQKGLPVITSTAVSWRLKALRNAPVLVGDRLLTLQYTADKSGNGGRFEITQKGC